MLEVRLIGAFEIACDGKPVALPSRFAQALFAYLILNAGTAHRREKLAGLFWPDSTEERARASLRYELWRIRKALKTGGADTVLLTDDITVGIDTASPYRLDVKDLDQLGPEASINQLMAGLAVYTGELLPGFYDDWLVVERERLQIAYEQRTARLLELLEAQRRWAEVLEWAERWLSLGLKPEAAYRALMIAYAGLGDRVKVLSTYERCVQALRDVGLEPSEQTRALAEVKTAVTTLPAPMTSFMGRESDLKEISALLLTFAPGDPDWLRRRRKDTPVG